MKFRIMPGQRVQDNTGTLSGHIHMVKRSPLYPDVITVKCDNGAEIAAQDSHFDPIPDPDNVPMIIVKAIIAKGEREAWDLDRLVREIREYCDLVLEGREANGQAAAPQGT